MTRHLTRFPGNSLREEPSVAEPLVLSPTDVSPDWGVDSEENSGYLGEPLDSDQLLFRRHAALSRRKRNVLFPNGVRLCSQETLEQVAANHLRYFHLRGTEGPPPSVSRLRCFTESLNPKRLTGLNSKSAVIKGSRS